jgi:hypothetical protein
MEIGVRDLRELVKRGLRVIDRGAWLELEDLVRGGAPARDHALRP